MLFKRAEEQVLSQWEQIKDSFSGSVKKMFPISGRKNTLELENLTFDDSKTKESDIKSQQVAKEQEKTWGIPVFGEFVLRDKETGNVINKSRQKIAVLPKMTQRFTYIIGGGEYNSAYQQRIKSGIYSKVNEKGEHLAEINLNGRNNAFVKEARLKIPFDLEKKKFNFSYATNNIPLYSMLKCVGVSDEDMKKTWGEDIWKANAKKNWQADIQKMYDKKWKGRGLAVEGDSFEHIQKAVTDALSKSAVLPETTKLTLGRPVEKLNGDILLETSLHVLKTARGEKSPDDMGSMVFKQLLGLDDFIAEKFGSPKTGMTMKQKIRNNVDRKDKVSSIISSDLFSKPLAQVFYSNALSQRPDQTNPLDILASKSQVTSMGPGGITSTHQLRPGMKMVNQTHMGFVDAIMTPECCPPDAYIFTKKGWKKFEEIAEEDLIACNVDGVLSFNRALKIHKSWYEGDLIDINTKSLSLKVTPNHRMWVRPLANKNASVYRMELAETLLTKPRIVTSFHEEVVLENKETILIGEKEVNTDDWADFLGWYFSEGSLSGSCHIKITQVKRVNPDKCEKIEELLKKLPWPWTKYDKDYVVSSRDVFKHLSAFGSRSFNKILPEYLYEFPSTARRKFIKSALLGDGRFGYLRKTGRYYYQQIYTTSSKELAKGFERIAISLGKGTSHKWYEDNRQERYHTMHELRILQRTETQILKGKHVKSVPYKGWVYCVTVPGGKILIKGTEKSIGIWTGNSEHTGISLHLPIGVRKIGREAKAYVYDMQEKKFVYRNPAEVHGEWTASPDQITWKNGEPVPVKPSIVAMSPENHEFVETPFSKVRYVIPSPRHLFAESTNAIPFLQCNQGNRTMTGSRQPTQGVSLVHREAPLVQVKSNTKDSFEKVFGSAFSHSAPEDGKIVDIVKDKLGHTDEIHVEDTKGQLHKVQIYNHFPLNEKKTYIHAEPNVSIGDVVKKGQTIADTNFSQSGVLATGINLRTGYVNYFGETYEDSVAISESAAKKLSSTHLHRPTLETNPGDVVSLNKYLAYASSAGKKITKDKLQHLDTDGIIKPGTRVKPGDILVAAVGKNEIPEDLAKLGARLKGAILPYRDKSLVWDNEHEGEVIKVVKKPGETGYSVHVKTVEPMRVGDKLCYDEETDVLTKTGWKNIKEVTLEDEICTLNQATHQIDYQNPSVLHRYPAGDMEYMYKVENDKIDLLVTLGHKMYVKSPSEQSFSLRAAREINGPVYYLTQTEEVLVDSPVIVPFSGPVFCVTVPNHVLYVRRNGKTVWSGNSGRSGDKNIVGAILPDEHMPRVGGPNGPLLDMLTSPTGVVSRINISQMLELGASKIAEKTGKPYITNNFQHGVDYAEKLRQEMKQHGLSDTDIIYDPLLKESLENPVMTGKKYIFKLKHQVEKKESVRGMDQSLARKYSINEDPSRGGGEGAQAIAQLDMYALLAHGARANLKEMTSYKAERQHNSETMADTDFWNRVMLGLPLQPPKATFAYKKFEGMLQGMGLNLKKEGYDTVLTPLTDKGVLHLSAGEITNSKMLRGKDDLEIAGGLFDKKITGGTSGKLHSHISLAEPFPNPLFVGTKAQPGPAVVLSGLKYVDFEKVVHGEKTVNIGGKEITGGKAINELLKKVDVNKEFEKTKEELKHLSGTTLDKANKKAKFLRALKSLNMKPHEAYIMNQFPVIPPIFRPVVPMGDGSIASADINTLYAHIIQDNNALKDKETLKYNPELYQKLNAAVYDKLKAAVGIGSVPLYEGNKELKGLAHSISGDNPKTGFFQNKIMKRRQDLSMRSTITPAPDLQMDQVGIPRDSAMALYKPFVIRTLIQSGKDLIEATKEVKEQTPMAWKALEHTIKERPVLIKRDPVLHKYNIQAYYPILKEGKSIGLHPLACAAFNSDFDGDQNLSLIIIYMNKESREEIERNFSGKCWYNIYGNKIELTEQYFEERKMPFINQSLPIIDAGGNFYVLNMADFPRGDLVHEDTDKKFYTVPEGIHVISYDQYTLEPKLARVTHTSVHSKKEVYIVNMSGRKQSFVDDDPRAVYGYDPDLRMFGRWRPEESLGKLVPCVKHFEFAGGKTELHFDKTKIKRIKERVPLNDETGYFLGCLVGDGWAASKQVVLANIEPEVVNKYKKGMDFFIENAHLSSHESEHTPFGLSAPIKHARHSLNAAGFEDLIGEWIGKGAQNKRLPPFTFSSCREFRLGVLAGLIDTDGSMSISHGKAKPQFMCNLSTTSIQLTLDIVALCKSLNITASVTSAKTPKGNDCWVVTFSSGDLYLIDLPIVNPDRLPAWNYLKTGDNPRETPSFISQDILPFHPAYRDILRRITRCNTVDNGVSLGVSIKNSAERRYITRQCAKTVLHHLWSSFTQEELDFLDPLIKMTLQEGVTWEIVESVERTGIYEEGFDITVPETETFCGADFVVRSNTMAVYLPLTEEARKEAIDKMLPSKNLFSSTNYGIMHAPDQESIIGLHLATFWGGKKDKTYNSLQDIVNDKTLHRSDVVKYKIGGVEKETTKGRALLASHLPSEFPQDKKDKLLHDSSFNFKKGSIHDYLETAARLDKKNHPNLVDGWRNIGNETAYKAGFSFSLSDLKPNKELRDKILNPYHAEVAKIRASSLGAQEKDDKAIELYGKATKELEKEFTDYYRNKDNHMHKMVDIKARGNFGQFRQTVIAPMLMADNNGVIPEPVTKSYSEGLSVDQYWKTLYGARMGTLARASGTSVPGALAKELSNIGISTTISSNDCGTTKGNSLNLIGHDGKEEIDVTDRYLAKDVVHNNMHIKAGTLVTPELFAKMKSAGIGKVEVRSPLGCKDNVGICQKCMGLSSEGTHHEIGTNIGMISSQALSEPAIQISMDSTVTLTMIKIKIDTEEEHLTIGEFFEKC